MNKKIVRVSDFYNNVCDTKKMLSELTNDESRASVYSQGIRNFFDAAVDNDRFEFDRFKSFLEDNYRDDFFSFDWQKKITVEDDLQKLKRFVQTLSGKCIASNTTCEVELSNAILRSSVNLITNNNGDYTAYIVRIGKANKSPGGKSTHTCSKNDLSVLCAKAILEKDYPGIGVALVFLTNDADSFGNIGDFVVSNTKKSNIFVNDFAEFKKDGVFSVKLLLEKIAKVYSEKPQPDCYNCFKKSLCSSSTVKNMKVSKAFVTEAESGYKVPVFTDAQRKVVEHVDGSMLVCAGPGSGKTATLIGRGVNLIKKIGVDPDFILAITFTNKAASELKERFKSALGFDTPKCATIHSLALEILLQNKSIVGDIKVLSQYEKMRIVEELADDLNAPLSGFSYSSGREGRVAFLKTLGNRLDACSADKELFCEKNPTIDSRFFALYEEYRKIVSARGFLTFDEVIKACVYLFEHNADILRKYQSMYKYIMVDEFQDIDGSQAKFIYSLAEHGNIVVVGDDDQSIYGFRGGSNKYMLQFKDTFDGTKVVVLDKNFRSDGKIVEAAEKLISRNKQRIEKKVEAVKKSGSSSIEEIEGQDAATLTNVVEKLHRKYDYDDIAVLSTKNATIEELAGEVCFPVTLGRAYLVKSPIFLIILDLLTIFDKGVLLSQKQLIHYFAMMGVSFNELSGYSSGGVTSIEAMKNVSASGELKKAVLLFEKMEGAAKNGCSAFYFIDEVVSFFGLEQSSIASAFDEMLESKHLKHLAELCSSMQQMIDSEDETKLEPDREGTVLFLTSHESKGMEFPCVIIIDDFKTDGSEETTRLFYVAMTRPKEKLVVLRKPGSKKMIS